MTGSPVSYLTGTNPASAGKGDYHGQIEFLLCLRWSLAVLRSLGWETNSPLPACLCCQCASMPAVAVSSSISLSDADLLKSEGSAPSGFLLVFCATTSFSTSDLLS